MNISGRTRLAGVMGWPVTHSLSPRLHNYWLKRYGIDGVYVPLAVPPGRLSRAVHALRDLGFVGVNVTHPHKEAAFAAVEDHDGVSARIRAVNTVVLHDDGSIRGMNTDACGFIEALGSRAPHWRAVAGPAVVLGAGGAARAILAALQDAGVPEIRLLNRTPARAEEAASLLGPPIRVVPWDQRAETLDGAALLVNTTTLGMSGQPPLDLALDALPREAVVNDIVYVPLMTPLLETAAARGNTVVDGLEMLLQQARPGFRAWFGRDPKVTGALRSFLRQELG